jgi:hypothetical protein
MGTTYQDGKSMKNRRPLFLHAALARALAPG